MSSRNLGFLNFTSGRNLIIPVGRDVVVNTGLELPSDDNGRTLFFTLHVSFKPHAYSEPSVSEWSEFNTPLHDRDSLAHFSSGHSEPISPRTAVSALRKCKIYHPAIVTATESHFLLLDVTFKKRTVSHCLYSTYSVTLPFPNLAIQ